MVGGAASPSATSVKATAEPLREDAKPAAVFVAGTKERLVLYSLVLLGIRVLVSILGGPVIELSGSGKCLEECIWKSEGDSLV